MTRLDQEQDVTDLAAKLGIDGNPVEGIVGYCQRRIDAWVDEAPTVSSVHELEAVVAHNLNLTFEEILSEDDLKSVIGRYVGQGETVFAALPVKMTPDTFGTLIRLKDGSYAAVVDARGEKAHRRFFTKWHEIAHLLVEDEDFDEQVFRATHDPIERLMDQIAGQVGFYEPVFTPLFRRQTADGDLLTFASVEQVRQDYCSYASFQSTLFACHRRMTTPVLYIEATMRHKAKDRRLLNAGAQFFFDDMKPEAKLRVSLVVPNDAATKNGFTVQNNMRIPESSVIHRAFGDDTTDLSGNENLGDWTFSDGGGLDYCDVYIEARSNGKTVMATIQPT